MNNLLTLNVITHKLNITCKFKHSMESNTGSTLLCCKLYTNQRYHLQTMRYSYPEISRSCHWVTKELDILLQKQSFFLLPFKSLKSNRPFLKSAQTTTRHSGLAFNVSIWLISQKFILLLHMLHWERQGKLKLLFTLLHENYSK